MRSEIAAHAVFSLHRRPVWDVVDQPRLAAVWRPLATPWRRSGTNMVPSLPEAVGAPLLTSAAPGVVPVDGPADPVGASWQNEWH
ncbi:hypothetical protein [Arthrobacter sp. SDTb3-6]|uniref:hypothetical protein n=1 Tax=Arthrobacter sp. SDTb3-6 TaxID=2713571 RepID=UPI00159EAE31|nr:hypothetical protein [Arthrobacter sp. SDTb3-6]NVM98190.1 hypothetical protein [Arthrobacter sp. SDTb3-6]